VIVLKEADGGEIERELRREELSSVYPHTQAGRPAIMGI